MNEKFVPDDPLPRRLEVINRLLSPSVAHDAEGRTTAIAIIPDLIPAELQLRRGWTHLYSIPRVWELENGAIHQRPHPALQALRTSVKTLADKSVTPEANLPLAAGQQLEIVATLRPNTSSRFGLWLGKNEANGEATKLLFDLRQGELVIDHTTSSREEMIRKRVEKGTLDLSPTEPIELRLFIDGSVIEGFINDRLAFTTRIFPQFESSNQVEVFAEDGTLGVDRIEVWKLRSSDNMTAF